MLALCDMNTNPEGADSFASGESLPRSAPISPIGNTSFEGVVEDSRIGGKNAEALRIATELYGGKPPKDYVEKVREGLMGEDH